MTKLFTDIRTLGRMFKQLFSILGTKQRLQCIFLLVGVFVCATLETLGVSAIIPFVLVLFNPADMMENQYVKIISDTLNISTYHELLIATAVTIVLVYLLKNVMILVFQYFQGKFHNEIERDLLNEQYRMFMSRPYAFYLNVNSADVMRGMSNDITQVAQVIDGFTGLISELVTLLMIGAFIIVMDPIIALGLVGTAILLAVVFILGFKKKTSSLGVQCREIFSKRYKAVLESVNGYKEISIYQKKDYFAKEYAEVNEEACKLNTSYLLIMKIPARVIETLFVAALLGLACLRITSGEDNGEFVALVGALAVAAIRLLPMISSISGYMNTLIYNRPGMEATYENITQGRKEKNGINSAWLGSEKKVSNISFNNQLTLQNISFRYDKSDRDIFSNISLTIKKNESVAFIGESGAGKSTLLDVLLGLLKPQTGTVLMDDYDINEIPFEWSQIVGYVPQSLYLLDDTVRRNIAFGIPDQEIDEERVQQVIKDAQLESFVAELPKGLDTTVGERGVRFSGGQRQRVAIARALYHNPQILVLDEATSALDNETEKEVMEAINGLHGKMTIVIVAHRLTTIEGCDRIYSVGDGKVDISK